MNGMEVIEKGDILIENNRIIAVGETGTLARSRGKMEVKDMSGKTIVPGFVDTHAHMWPNWGLHKKQCLDLCSEFGLWSYDYPRPTNSNYGCPDL